MKNSIRKNLQVIQEERERKQVALSIVESRLLAVAGGPDFFERFDSLTENQKVKVSFLMLMEMNTILEYDLISEQDLASQFKGIFGNLFSSSFESIMEPVIRKIIEWLGLDPKSFISNSVVSLLTTNPLRTIRAMGSCEKFSRLLAEVLAEAFAMEIQQSVNGKGFVLDVLRNAVGGSLKETEFINSLTNNIHVEVCKIFTTLFKNAKNLMGQALPSGF